MRGALLLLGSWAIDLPGQIVRLVIGFLIAAAVDNAILSPLILLAMTYTTWGPLLALVWPTGHFITRWQYGAREASQREQEAVEAAFNSLVGNYRRPAKWFVIDAPMINAFVVGNTLYINRETIRSDALAAILAHELGHLNSTDGRYVLAANRLISPILTRFAGATATLGQQSLELERMTGRKQGGCTYIILAWSALLLGGGMGLRLLAPLWLLYMRDREYLADEYAAALAQGGQLIAVLETYSLPLDTAVPFVSLLYEKTHPYTELRIDKLMQLQQGDIALQPPIRSWLCAVLGGIPLVFVLGLIGFITYAILRV